MCFLAIQPGNTLSFTFYHLPQGYSKSTHTSYHCNLKHPHIAVGMWIECSIHTPNTIWEMELVLDPSRYLLSVLCQWPFVVCLLHTIVMLVCCIPKQVTIDFKSKFSCGSFLGSPDRIKDMNLPEVMILLICLLEEGDSHCFWNLVSLRDKTIKQPELLLEVTEKLSGGTFPTISKVQVFNVCSQGDNFMLCNTTFDCV